MPALRAREIMPADPEEFALWYEDQVSRVAHRFTCVAGASIRQNRVGANRLANAVARVLARHPEAFARYSLDRDGILVRSVTAVNASAIPVEIYGPQWTLKQLVGAVAAQPMSTENGVLVHAAVLVDGGGRGTHVIVSAHHIVWDVSSEDLFWSELDSELELHADIGMEENFKSADRGGSRQGWTLPEPDLQSHFRLDDSRRIWDQLANRAHSFGVTRFSWVTGHLAAAVARVLDVEQLNCMADLDLRPLSPSKAKRLGFNQTQISLGSIRPGVTGEEAARQFHLRILELLARATNGEEIASVESRTCRTCKFYVRQVRELQNLCPIDLPVPLARNALSVGVTAVVGGIDLTVTARRESLLESELHILCGSVGAETSEAAKKEGAQ